MSDAFRHEPLDLQTPSFRLLVLHPPSPVSRKEIHGSLVVASFDGADDFGDLIPYEALSHTWNTPSYNSKFTSRCMLILNDRVMEITANLFAALKMLQQSSDRWLWIDSICIDQQNDVERAHQVRQMGEIYNRAQNVVVWLGEPSLEVHAVFHCLEAVERSMRPLKQRITETEFDQHWKMISSQHRQIAQGLRVPGSDDIKPGVAEILTNRWFHRVWIIQEIANAKRATVQCGHHSVSSRIFAYTARLANYQPDPHVAVLLDLMKGPRSRPKWWDHRDLRTLLIQFAAAEATEERDKVFALLNICDLQQHTRARKKIGDIVDYSAAPEVVLNRAASFIFPECRLDSYPIPGSFRTFPEFFGNLGSLEAKLVTHDRIEHVVKAGDFDSAQSLLRWKKLVLPFSLFSSVTMSPPDVSSDLMRLLLEHDIGFFSENPEFLWNIITFENRSLVSSVLQRVTQKPQDEKERIPDAMLGLFSTNPFAQPIFNIQHVGGIDQSPLHHLFTLLDDHYVRQRFMSFVFRDLCELTETEIKTLPTQDKVRNRYRNYRAYSSACWAYRVVQSYHDDRETAAFQTSPIERIQALRNLHRYGADMQTPNEYDLTPLMYAAWSNDLPLLELLLPELGGGRTDLDTPRIKKPARFDFSSRRSSNIVEAGYGSALDMAYHRRHDAAVSMLVRAGAGMY